MMDLVLTLFYMHFSHILIFKNYIKVNYYNKTNVRHFENSFGVFPLENSDNLSVCSSQSMVLVPSATLNETNDQKFISKRVSLEYFKSILLLVYLQHFF